MLRRNHKGDLDLYLPGGWFITRECGQKLRRWSSWFYYGFRGSAPTKRRLLMPAFRRFTPRRGFAFGPLMVFNAKDFLG